MSERTKMASGIVSGSGIAMESIKHTLSFSRHNSVYGTRLPLGLHRAEARRTPKYSPLICVAVVWWSDARRQIQSDWEKVHKLRLQTLANRESASKEPVVQSDVGVLLDHLGSKIKSLYSAGLTPEVLFGRMAMLGFFGATTVEVETGKSVLQQMTFRGDIFAAVVAIGVLLMSLRKLEEDESDGLFKPFGMFTPKVERLSGQAAMFGFALLVVIESAKGSALF